MSEFMSYDPWAEITTRNGYAGDEMVAMLQKAIRRGKEEDALHAAYEMYITSPQFEEKLWRRLLCISVEDIGFGNPDAPNLVYTLFKMRQEFPYNDGDRPMFFVHAIRYLCRQKKERSSDHVKNLLNHEFEVGTKFEVPDYALDMHTRRGREMGRDVYHFLTEASRVEPYYETEGAAEIYEKYKALLESEDQGENAPMRLNSIPGSIEEIPGFGIAKTGDLCSAAQSMTVRVRPMPTLAAVSFFQVLQPQMPSAVRLTARWNARTAFSVPPPKMPSSGRLV